MARIEGIEDCMRALNALPENGLKMAKAALKEASKQTTKKVRTAIPKRWRRLVRHKVYKNSEDNLTAMFGLYNKHQKTGQHKEVDDWFKAYWANYGTLTRRDPEHHFQYPVKRASRSRRNNVGQRPQKYFESATAGWESVFMPALEESLAKQEEQLYER